MGSRKGYVGLHERERRQVPVRAERQSLVQTLSCAVLALATGMASHVCAAGSDGERARQWAEAAARQSEAAERRQRAVRQRFEYERRRSAAHARMANTLYASTPSAQAHTDFSCPALPDADGRRLVRRSLDGVDLTAEPVSRKSGITVFPAGRSSTSASSSYRSDTATGDKAGGHLFQASGWTSAAVAPKSATGVTQHVYLFPSASEALREGFVRIINHAAEAGEIRIDPVDDSGRALDAITLAIGAGETVHFNSGDLETGNTAKGLSGGTGSGQGDWRLTFSSDLDIEVLSYIRTQDGFLTAMHDVAPLTGNVREVAIFNPGSNRNQVSRLRLVNPSDKAASVTIRGTDDRGMPGSGEVTLSLKPGTAREITAAELESGASNLTGSLGAGAGKWRLDIESDRPVVVMSLLESPTDHLTNLSTVPDAPDDGIHRVPLFPGAGGESGREGFLRVINRSASPGEVTIKAYDESDWDYDPIRLSIGAGEVAHFNSDDLEQGNRGKGLSGGTGDGTGDWRLDLTSGLDIRVLSYIRTDDGFLTAMHDVAPSAGNTHRLAVFNPGSNLNQESLLRLINPGDEAAQIEITGIDGRGASGASPVRLTLPAGGTRTVAAYELEEGGDGLEGALGDGAGKWQLRVASDVPVVAMGLLQSPTKHLTNLSTAPVRGARGGATREPQTAESVFRQSVSPIVQSKCATCHVEGGASGNTRLVFVTDDNADHEAVNLRVFRDFLDEVDDGANYLLNKIQGALNHGGATQVAAGTEAYAAMQKFLSLLGEDVGPVVITPDTLFDGVTMESARSTLRRAAIVFAGRIPTQAEYDSIKTGGLASLRKAIRALMVGPEFHEFLLRAGNDRLLTDRDKYIIASGADYFVDLANLYYEKATGGIASDELDLWDRNVQFGVRRAPLELIRHIAEYDLPYTEVLTADYIMANPLAAEAYGARTAFDDPDDLFEFKPSEIVSYYRNDESKVSEYDARLNATRVVDPGDLITEYPHAGILNTTVFLLRYPTTATNRNRARSRWTYYHFLGLDVEKSASRTTDPVALADTNNPTMNNAACTVCHGVLDPVAGAFQNYGDEGLYRDQWGGMDSLDGLYRQGDIGGWDFTITARSFENRDIVSTTARIPSGSTEIGLAVRHGVHSDGGSTNIHVDYLSLRDASGTVVDRYELETLGDGDANWDGRSFEICCETLIVPVDVPSEGDYNIEMAAWVGYEDGDAAARSAPGTLRMWPGDFYRDGDTWYRDMRDPGFDGKLAPNPDNSLQWLAERIVADDRFAAATVKFWWPAIMGGDVAEPPSEGDPDFEGRLLASNAQAAEVARLAAGFRRGFLGGRPYNLKDLLVEIVLSTWFRATAVASDNKVRAVALAGAGARRLLTPEELYRKTVSLTGFGWERWKRYLWEGPEVVLNWTNAGWRYGLLYGGIDSDGITKRGRDLTSVMAGVAQRHAGATACPVVMKEFFLLGDSERRLFSGFDLTTTPVSEFYRALDIEAASWNERETVRLSGPLTAGPKTVGMVFTNNDGDDQGGDRNIRLYRLRVLDADGTIVEETSLKHLKPPVASWGECGRANDWNPETGEHDHFNLHSSCGPVELETRIPAEGTYTVEVVAWADQYGDELAELEIVVNSDTVVSAGAGSIRSKLAELLGATLGVEAGASSPDVQAAFDLFVDVWNRGRDSDVDGDFLSLPCDFVADQHYFDGFADDIWREELDENGYPLGWDWERLHEFLTDTGTSDPHHVARTWVVVLAYLMTDPRYLHL